jgi:hypothetical protein
VDPLATLRSPRREHWTAVAALGVLAVLAGLLAPTLAARPTVAGLVHSGPATAEALTALLIVPEGATAERTRRVSLDELATQLTVDVGGLGVRWSVAVDWTGREGAGTLRLTQFHWPSGAQRHLAQRLAGERERPTVEEWSVPGRSQARVLAYESGRAGQVVRGLYGRGPIVAEVQFSAADPTAAGAMTAFLARLADRLPGEPWPNEPPDVAPMDLAALLPPVPAGATLRQPPRTLWLLRFAHDYYETAAGLENLERLRFKRAATVGWDEPGGDTFVLVTLLRFGDGSGAREWTTGTAEAGLRARPTPEVGQVPNVDGGHYAVYGNLPAAQGRYGEAVLLRDTVAAMVQIYGAGATGDRLIAFAREQYARLP